MAVYSIGDMARLGGLSPRMLRHYDEIGLFPPAEVEANGYRRYDQAQLVALHRIVALRDLGFGLDAITRLVGRQLGPDELRDMLLHHRAELEAERDLLDGRLQRLCRHLDRLDPTLNGGTAMPTPPITIKALEPLHVAEVTALSPTFDPVDIGPAVSPLYPQLLGRIAAAGVELIGVPLAWYDDDPAGQGIVVHAAAPIPDGVRGIDGVAIVDLEPVDQAVCSTHLGDMAGIEATVVAMLDWAADHGLRTIGYTREIYLACPDDRAGWVTEIQLPVVKDPGAGR